MGVSTLVIIGGVLFLGISFPAYSYAKELQDKISITGEKFEGLEVDIIQYIQSLSPVDYGTYSVCLEDKEHFSVGEWEFLLKSAEEGKIVIFDTTSEQVTHWQENSQTNNKIILEKEGEIP